MKPAACILIVLVLFSIAQPILVQCQASMKEPAPATTCCSNSAKQKETSPKPANKTCDRPASKDCDRNSTCNPFASCSQAQYIATSKFLYAGELPEGQIKKHYSPSENIESGFLADCWHPPESMAV